MPEPLTVEIDGKPVEVIPKADHDAAFARMRVSAEATLLKDPAFLDKVVETHGQTLAEKLTAKHPPKDQQQVVEAAQRPLKEQLLALTQKVEARDARLAESELRRVAGEYSTRPDLVVQVLKSQVRTADDGTVAVIDANGAPAFGANGPMQVQELVAGWLAQTPELAKAQGRSGAGVQGTTPAGAPSSLQERIADAEKKGDLTGAQILKAELLKSLSAR
jgi:hypothetical protein